MKKDLKSIGRYVTGDVWSASVTRGSHDAYKKEYQANVGWVADSHRINAERICNGERVGECWLRGRLKQELLDFGLLSRSDFDKYGDIPEVDLPVVTYEEESS